MIKVTIHWDFTDGTELSFIEGLKAKKDFTTCCTHFFHFQYEDFDVTVVKKDGAYINSLELLEGNSGGYTIKGIRKAHNIEKLLIANHFNWKRRINKI